MDLLDRISQQQNAMKAAPRPGALMPASAPSSSGSSSIATYPRTFPGWLDRQQDQGAAWINRPLTDEQRARLAVTSSWVYSDIATIAQELSTATLQVKQQQAGEQEEDIEAHPLELLWERPNPFMGRSYLMQFWTWNLLLSGEAYIYAAPAGDGIAELWPVPSFMMEPEAHPTEFISGYLFKAPDQDTPVRIPREHIIYTRIPHPFDPRRGLGPLVAGFAPMGLDLSQAGWNRSFFAESNGVPASVVSMPRDMSNSDFNRVTAELRTLFGGGKRGTLYTRAGEIDIKLLSFSPEQMQFLGMREFNREEIDRIFGIPGGYWSEGATRANATHANGALIGGAVWPRLQMLAEDINAQFVETWYGDGLSVAFEDIRPKEVALDLQQRQTWGGYWTIDELRAEDGKPPIDEERAKAGLPPIGAKLMAEVGGQGGPGGPQSHEGQQPNNRLQGTQAALDQGAEAPIDQGATPEGEIVGGEGEAAAEEAKRLDLQRWERKALKAWKERKRPTVRFASAHISQAEGQIIYDRLTAATSVAHIKEAFKAAAGRVTADSIEALLDEALLAEAARIAEEAKDGDQPQADH